jgi:hypothetical protein
LLLCVSQSTFPFFRSPSKDTALTPPVKVEYESDAIPSPELGVLPPKRTKGKNRARSPISPINLVSEDETPADSTVER